MIDCLSILSALREYYSVQGTDEELAPLCTAAAKEIMPRIKNGAEHSDIRLINLAAAMVNHRLCVRSIHSDEGITSFKAGDVTISISPAALVEQAEKEKAQAMMTALPLLKNDGFFFGQVTV
ncbi:MAG: hypothetical protein U0L11_02635 [Acutalibacteraceae bacterium]|nr:hypothetical protein [Acutalibacteraceae bacterium]